MVQIVRLVCRTIFGKEYPTPPALAREISRWYDKIIKSHDLVRRCNIAIVFESAQPFDAQTAFQTGQRVQQQEEFANYLREQQQAHQQYMQQAQFQQGQQEFAVAADQRQQGLNASNQEFLARQQPSERDRFLGEQEIKQMKARGEIQMAMRDHEFTQADKMRLQQKQNSLSEIQAAVDRGELRPAEAAPIILGIKADVDVQQGILKQQQAKYQQQRQIQMEAEAKKAAEIEQNAAAFRAQNLPGAMRELPGGYGSILIKPNGDPMHLPAPKPDKPPQMPKSSEILKMRDKAIQAVDGVRDRNGNIVPGTGMLAESPAGREVWLPGQREAQIEIEFQKLLDLASQGGQGGQPSAPGGGVQSAQGGRQEPQQPAAPPQAAPRPAPAPPLPPDRKAWKPEQVSLIDAGESEVKKLAAMRSPDMKAAAVNLEKAMEIYRATGGQPAATPETEAQYAHHMGWYRKHLEAGSK